LQEASIEPFSTPVNVDEALGDASLCKSVTKLRRKGLTEGKISLVLFMWL
jgi:hypothetical protein